MSRLRIKKKSGDPSESEQEHEDPTETEENAEFATKTELAEVKQGLDAVKTGVQTLTTEFETVGQSVAALVESLKGSEKTPAQKKEMAEAQLEDAQEINKKRRGRAIPIYGDESVKIGEDFLIKGVTPELPRKEAKENFYTALKSDTDDANLIEFQTRCDRIKMKCELLNKRPYELEEFVEWQDFLEKTGFDDVVKLISLSTTTDFVPEGWSNQIEKYYYLNLKVADLFNEFPMPHSPFRWDILGRPEAKYHGETPASARGAAANEIDADDPDQGVVTFTARKLTVRVDLTEEFVEDSVDMYYNVLSQEMIPEGMAEGVEIATLNGDRDGTHQDNGITATSPASAWDGLRKMATERTATQDVTADSGSFNYGRLADLIEKGGKYLLNPMDTAWICNIGAYTEILDFNEVKTVDNFGQMATNVKGAVMMLMGRPLIVSEHIPLVGDDGFVSATVADNVHDTLLLVNKKQFRCGNRPVGNASEVLFDPLTRVYYFTLVMRKDFQSMQPRVAGYTPVSMTLKG